MTVRYEVGKGIVIACAVVCLSFFLLFTFHATTPQQAQAKQYLDGISEQAPFFGDEQEHMVDVKNVLDGARIFSAIIIVLGLVAFERRTRFSSVFAGTVLIGLPLILVMLPWDVLFTQFHHIFFPQGNWIFAYNSEIIQTYPQSLFMWFAGIWAGICLLTGAALMKLWGNGNKKQIHN